MNLKLGLVVLFLLVGVIFECEAGQTVSLRLVKASNEGQGVSKGLEDVGKLLQSQLPFKNYRMVDEKACSIPANKTIKMALGILVNCSGSQENFTINITQNGKELLKTTFSLLDNKPLILGGFPDKPGKLMLILLVK